MNLVKWKLLETFGNFHFRSLFLGPFDSESQEVKANGLLRERLPSSCGALDIPGAKADFGAQESILFLKWFHLCVHVRPESILRYVTSVTICHHLSPSVWKDSLCLFNDLIACLKGEGMLRWTSPWEPQASQDRCLKMSWFLLRFCFIQNLRVWWLGQFQTFNARCKSMHLFWGFWLLAFRIVQHCHYSQVQPVQLWSMNCECLWFLAARSACEWWYLWARAGDPRHRIHKDGVHGGGAKQQLQTSTRVFLYSLRIFEELFSTFASLSLEFSEVRALKVVQDILWNAGLCGPIKLSTESLIQPFGMAIVHPRRQ